MVVETERWIVDIDLDKQEKKLRSVTEIVRKFGHSLTDAFAKGIVGGKDFESILKSIGNNLVAFGTKLALKPLEQTIANGLDTLLQGLFKPSLSSGLNLSSLGSGIASALSPQANGNAFSLGRVQPFASGGVVATPTFFPMARGLGLMGEAGPEAVMPLSRGPDGRLGVAARGTARPVTVTVNIATHDAESFRRSEAQVSAALARAVARGQRAL